MMDKLDKIIAHQSQQKILFRKRVAEILDAAPPEVAVFIVAPYGYGKTFAVLSWLKERDRKACWITLGESDKEVSVFTEHLASVLLPLAKDQDVIGILSDTGYKKDPGAFLRRAASNAAAGNIAADTLVIDNFLFLHNSGLLNDIKDFVYSLIGHMRVIIISRAQFPPVFNDLILKNHICLISIQELSFDIDEMAEYFIMNGHIVHQQNLEQIHDETEGWPAAINVAMTISREGTFEYGEDARSYINSFFDIEIWDVLDEDIKVFLMKTSILETLTPSSCHAVTAAGATLPILNRLFQNGLFISRQGEKNTYRYHRVFKDFLLEKLDFSGIDKRELYKKAGWWHFEKDKYEQAFPYFIKSGDMHGLSQALKEIGSTIIGKERYDFLVSNITLLNTEDLRDYPYIAVRIALLYYSYGNLDEMQRIYDTLLDWNRSGELRLSPEDYLDYIWELGLLGYLNPNELNVNNERHNEWFNFSQDHPSLRERFQSRAAIIRNRSVLSGLRDFCPTLRGIVELEKYDKETVKKLIHNDIALLQIDIIRAEYEYELENFVKAEKIIQAVIPEIEEYGLWDLYFICIVVLTKIEIAVRGPGGIKAMENRMQKIIETRGCDYMWPRFHEYQQLNRLAEGLKGQTEAFVSETKDYIGEPYIYTLTRHITLAHALLSTDDYSEAIMLLGTLETLCHKYKRIKDLIEVHILRAVADYCLGHEENACHYLSEAIESAREYGFIRVFSDEAKDIWPILELVRKQKSDAYIKKIIISCKKVLSRAGFKLPEKLDELTKTELKILKCLQANMSYEETALDNGIKVSTVKSHVHSLYSKLHVDNRMSAIMVAQNAGILE